MRGSQRLCAITQHSPERVRRAAKTTSNRTAHTSHALLCYRGTRDRTRSAMAVKRANGQRIAAIPYGFDIADDGTTLLPNEAEQAVIDEVRAIRAVDMKLQQIASTRTSRGGATKTGKSSRWTHHAVARILERESA